MFNAARSMFFSTAALALLAMTAAGCGGGPTSAPKAQAARKAAPLAPAAAPTAPAKAPAATQPAAATATGAVTIMLSSLKADGVHGVAVQLSGPGLSEPIAKTLTAEELKTSNTLAFENIPVGTMKAEVLAFDKAEESLGGTSTDVVVKADAEAKVAIQLSAPAEPVGPIKVDFKLVAPEAFDASPAPASTPKPSAAPSSEPTTPASPAPTGGTPAKGNGKALSVELIDKQVVRKYLIFKKLQVTVRVTNQNDVEALDGEVKVEFHKLKGLLTKEDVIVQTMTAPVEGLKPGKSVEITLTSTESAEDAEATVHTILASSSASTYE